MKGVSVRCEAIAIVSTLLHMVNCFPVFNMIRAGICCKA